MFFFSFFLFINILLKPVINYAIIINVLWLYKNMFLSSSSSSLSFFLLNNFFLSRFRFFFFSFFHTSFFTFSETISSWQIRSIKIISHHRCEQLTENQTIKFPYFVIISLAINPWISPSVYLHTYTYLWTISISRTIKRHVELAISKYVFSIRDAVGRFSPEDAPGVSRIVDNGCNERLVNALAQKDEIGDHRRKCNAQTPCRRSSFRLYE